MKRWICEILMAAVVALIIPWFLVCAVVSAQPETTVEAETTVGATEVQNPDPTISVKTDHGIVTMKLEDYLTSVLLAELPASFSMEAKMAQAVVARTYALRTAAVTDKHPGSVCTESSCCQGYRSPEDYISAGGTTEAVEQAREAVRQTGNNVLTYNNELIEATYFACSGGYTEPAVAVWGADVPYLQAVPSPGEEGAAHYSDRLVMSPAEFAAALGLKLSGDPAGWFGPATYTQGGGVAWMTVGGVRYSGIQLRSLLELRSTAFTITVAGNEICITTKGHGHRVGMSQYGAQAMAQNGSTWRQILAHYYPGSEISTTWEK